MAKVVEGILLHRVGDMLLLEGGMGQATQLVHMQHPYRPTPMELPTPTEVCLPSSSCLASLLVCG